VSDELEEIALQFRANLDRVRGLVSLYEEYAPGGPGRKPVPAADLLRAGVVLLHATLEDLLRSLAGWKLPAAPAESLRRVKLAGSGKPKETFTLVELADYRGQTVDAVIARSVAAHLDRATYNHPGEIVELLANIELSGRIEGSLKNSLAALMSRRHQIAHRADRNPLTGAGHQRAESISATLVKRWVRTVEGFADQVFSQFRSSEVISGKD
jgi:hypothetical protein